MDITVRMTTVPLRISSVRREVGFEAYFSASACGGVMVTALRRIRLSQSTMSIPTYCVTIVCRAISELSDNMQ